MGLRHRERWGRELFTALMPILPLLEDDAVTEIEVNGWNSIYAKGYNWRGHKLMEGIRWPSHADLLVACSSVAEVSERVVSEESPLFDGRLPGGERINIVVPPLVQDVAITIRKFPSQVMTIDKLLGYGSIDDNVALMLKSLVRARKNIVISGGTESGKTSLLNALSGEIPLNERVIANEDARELMLVQENKIQMETLKPWKTGQKEVTIADLVKNNLRQSPDRIVVGEVRGPEAIYLLRALCTGHDGGLSTVHANNANDALEQMILLCQFADIGSMNFAGLANLVARAIDVVVHVTKIEQDGSRKVVEIVEVARPKGIIVHTSGFAEFVTRTLLSYEVTAFEKVDGKEKAIGRWLYPQAPSAQLQKTLNFKGLPWPQVSLEAAG